MASVERARHRRDFVLDSGGLSGLARQDSGVGTAWLKHIATTYECPAVIVPTAVLTESVTGYPSDAPVNLFLRILDDPANPGGFWAPITPEIARRAGALRADASRKPRSGKGTISATDAQVVAIAEERSYHAAVTILTSDPRDIEMLVEETGRPNIAIEIV